MILVVHSIFFSCRLEESGVYLLGKLNFAAAEAGDGWLIFNVPAAAMDVHPFRRVAGSVCPAARITANPVTGRETFYHEESL